MHAKICLAEGLKHANGALKFERLIAVSDQVKSCALSWTHWVKSF